MPIETSRRQQMKKKKKANLLINSLIGIVGILIIITLVNLLSNNDEVAEESIPVDEENPVAESTEDEGQQEVESQDLTSSEVNETDEDTNSEETVTNEESSEEDTTTEESSITGEVVTEPSTDPIVDEAFTNSAWQPIGTSQSGAHTSSYDPNSVDWAEKVKALSYAGGLSEDNMYIKFLGNGGSPHKSVGTITSKDESEKYRVYLEWVDGQGWKPTKVEVLNQLP